jgi:hypothetical protein
VVTVSITRFNAQEVHIMPTPCVYVFHAGLVYGVEEQTAREEWSVMRGEDRGWERANGSPPTFGRNVGNNLSDYTAPYLRSL